GARAQPQRAALDDLHVVVDEAEQRAGDRCAEHADSTPVLPIREDRERRRDRDEHDDPAHRRRACLVQMTLRAVIANVLAELAPAQELDELRREEDADQQGGGAADQDLCHQRPASASATRSRATPRDPLTSTVSPACRRARTSSAAAAASGACRCSPAPKLSPAQAARKPTVTSSATPATRACSPSSRW